MNRNVALIYVRVSRLDRDDRIKQQEGNGAALRALSPTTQVEQCRALPSVRGLQVEVFEDLHRSGKETTKREQLARLRERIKDPDVALVAVWSISRLARSVRDLYDLLEEFQAAGVAFVSAKESIDTSHAAGRAFVGILAVLAQFERELTSDRMKANVEQAARGGALVGQLPAGYVRDESGAVVLDGDRAVTVRRLFEEYATGKHSFLTLAVWANDAGLKPPQRRRHGKREQLETFTHDSVRDLICNIRYTGRLIHLRRVNPYAETIAGNYPAIIDEDLWERCAQLRRAAHRAHLIPTDRRVSAYALTGILRCGSCGDNVRGDLANGHGGRRYMCRRRVTAKLCHESQVKADVLEEQAREWLESIRIRPEWAKFYAGELAAGTTRATPSPRARVKALEAKLERMRHSYDNGARTDKAAYDREVAEVRGELEAARSAREPQFDQQARTLNSLVDQWDEMTPAQKKRLLSTVFSEITMHDRALATATPHPDWERYVEEAIASANCGQRGNRTPTAKGG